MQQVLTNAPVRGYALPGLPYQLYSDACDLAWHHPATSTEGPIEGFERN